MCAGRHHSAHSRMGNVSLRFLVFEMFLWLKTLKKSMHLSAPADAIVAVGLWDELLDGINQNCTRNLLISHSSLSAKSFL